MEQQRAKAGGEFGVNGEFYEGGKFLPSRDDRSKQAPPERRQLSPEELAEVEARRARDREAASRHQAWLAGRREMFSHVIELLTAQPVGHEMTPEAWARSVENHAAGFYPSLGRTLFVEGQLSRRQAEFVAKYFIGPRQNKRNRRDWEALVDGLCGSQE